MLLNGLNMEMWQSTFKNNKHGIYLLAQGFAVLNLVALVLLGLTQVFPGGGGEKRARRLRMEERRERREEREEGVVPLKREDELKETLVQGEASQKEIPNTEAPPPVEAGGSVPMDDPSGGRLSSPEGRLFGVVHHHPVSLLAPPP